MPMMLVKQIMSFLSSQMVLILRFGAIGLPVQVGWTKGTLTQLSVMRSRREQRRLDVGHDDFVFAQVEGL